MGEVLGHDIGYTLWVWHTHDGFRPGIQAAGGGSGGVRGHHPCRGPGPR